MDELKDTTDATKLRFLADWLDQHDAKAEGEHSNEVQLDLRRIADKLDTMRTLSNHDRAKIWQAGFEAGERWTSDHLTGIMFEPPPNPYRNNVVVFTDGERPCSCCAGPDSDIDEGRVEEQWCVYVVGDQDDDIDPESAVVVNVYDQQAEAEEMQQWVADSRIARRTVAYSPWQDTSGDTQKER